MLAVFLGGSDGSMHNSSAKPDDASSSFRRTCAVSTTQTYRERARKGRGEGEGRDAALTSRFFVDRLVAGGHKKEGGGAGLRASKATGAPNIDGLR